MPEDKPRARAALLLVAVLWGLNWVSVKFALRDFSPWSFRAITLGGGMIVMMAAARLHGDSLAIPRGLPRLHVAIAGVLNIAGYGLFSAFAQLGASTSRVAICAFTMPIWATLLARPILGETLDRFRVAALAAGAAGLAILLWPLVTAGLPIGVLYALGAAVTWACGTVYLKWARIAAHPLAITAWQLAAGTVAVVTGLAIAGIDTRQGLHLVPVLGLAYSTLLGTALAYLLWFQSVARLPASTAGLGSLLVPVVGVAAAILMLGERPDAADLTGFALILLAALCALAPRPRSGTAALSDDERRLA
jgi:drug/metabolite transporter (DMT)-like permease